MKTLQKVQEENRKFIIMANNPTAKTYEEALEMELDIGCIASVNGNDPQLIIAQGFDYDKQEKVFGFTYAKDIESTCDDSIFFFPNCSDLKIIGKPLTLNRVLIALRNYYFSKIWYFCFDAKSCNIYGYNHKEEIIFTAYWDLTENTLEEQSEETQRKINELIK